MPQIEFRRNEMGDLSRSEQKTLRRTEIYLSTTTTKSNYKIKFNLWQRTTVRDMVHFQLFGFVSRHLVHVLEAGRRTTGVTLWVTKRR